MGIEELIESYENDDGEIDTPNMVRMMKDLRMSPYYFLSLATIEATVKDNFIAAHKYVDYARQFEGEFFNHEREERAFGVLLDQTEAFLILYAADRVNQKKH